MSGLTAMIAMIATIMIATSEQLIGLIDRIGLSASTITSAMIVMSGLIDRAITIGASGLSASTIMIDMSSPSARSDMTIMIGMSDPIAATTVGHTIDLTNRIMIGSLTMIHMMFARPSRTITGGERDVERIHS